MRHLRPPGLSLKSQLALLLLGAVLLSTVVLGWLAYTAGREAVEREALRAVGIAAAARRDVLLGALGRQQDRMREFGRIARASCTTGADRRACLQRELEVFAATEGVPAALLRVPREALLAVGDVTALLATVPAPGRLAHVIADVAGGRRLALHAALAEPGWAVALVVRQERIDHIFLDRSGLGESGETFLTDAEGQILSPGRPRPPGPASPRTLTEPLRTCLDGHAREVMKPDARNVVVIHGFRQVPEIGGGCIMARIDHAEALAPARRLRDRVVGLSAAFAAIAVGLSVLLARSIARPLDRLTAQARAIERGEQDAAIDVAGPREVASLAETFSRMLASVRESLGRERQARADAEASEARYRALFNDNPVGLYRSAPDGRILEVNDALTAMLGYPDRRRCSASAPSTPTSTRPIVTRGGPSSSARASFATSRSGSAGTTAPSSGPARAHGWSATPPAGPSTSRDRWRT